MDLEIFAPHDHSLKKRTGTKISPDIFHFSGLFATRNGSPSERWNLLRKHLKPAAKKLRLCGVTWHLLSHSHATMLDSVGTPLGTMQSLLGHSTPEITREIYLHAIPEEQRRAVESVERLVFGPKWTQVQAPAQVGATRAN
jgi:integrase